MLAIIIPYFKLTFFEATLQSLANQTDKRFKVYIGDDASPEDCSALLKKFERKFDFLYHRFNTNLGGTALTKQWERCIALSADEEWLMILGDDDVLGENVVEEFYKNMDEIVDIGCNVVRFATQILENYKLKSDRIFLHPISELFADSFYRKISGLTRSSLSEHIFTKASFLKYGFKNFNLAWYSDDYAWLKFSENRPLFSINIAIVKIRISSESISGNTTLENKKNIAKYTFFKELIANDLRLFKKEQKIKVLHSFENSVLKLDNVEYLSFLRLFLLYITLGQYKRPLQMIKKQYKLNSRKFISI